MGIIFFDTATKGGINATKTALQKLAYKTAEVTV